MDKQSHHPNIPFTHDSLNLLLAKAARRYWKTRQCQAVKQKRRGKSDAGTRGQVTGGKQLDGFAELVKKIGILAGIPSKDIHFNASFPLPGYYRPQKNWDVVFMKERQLLAAIELKSQSGSFGNNFNNRAEEVLGVSRDFWIAYREKAFGTLDAPWLGYFLFVEESEGSSHPVNLKQSPLPPMPVFENSSYLRRYEILCERLMLERDYSSTALVLSDKSTENIRDGGENVSAFGFFKSLFLFLKAHS